MFNINNARQFLGNVYQNYIQPIASVLPSVDTVKKIAELTFIGGAMAYVPVAAVCFFEEACHPMKDALFVTNLAVLSFIGANLCCIGANTLVEAWNRWLRPVAPVAPIAFMAPIAPIAPTHPRQPTLLKNLTAQENTVK